MFKLKFIYFVVLVAFIAACGPQNNQVVTVSPENPTPTSKISISYNPSQTGLKDSENVEMVVFQYDVDLESTTGIEMKKDGSVFTGDFSPAENTKGFLVIFRDGDLTDNNNKQGYFYSMYTEDGKEMPGAKAGLAVAQAQWSRYYADLEYDNEIALNTFQEAFKIEPKLKEKYMGTYIYTLQRFRSDSMNAIIEKELGEFAKIENLDEDQLRILVSGYSQLQKKDLAKQYKDMIFAKNPEGDYAKQEELKNIQALKDSKKQLKEIKNFSKKYNDTESTKALMYRIGRKYLDNKEYKNFSNFIDSYSQEVHPYLFSYSAGKLSDVKGQLKLAEKVARFALENNNKELENPSSDKPVYMTKGDWKKQRESSVASSLVSMSKIQEKMGQKDKALDNMKKAIELNGGEDAEANELYTSLLLEKGQAKEAMVELEKFVVSGKNTAKMVGFMKDAFVKVNGSEEGFDAYQSKFLSEAEAHLLTELKAKMIEEDAPQFSLLDLEGNTVSLADFKGKTVIVDFWATWCGPCLSSFPAMQEAVNKYEADPNVQFLFLNAWERVEDKKQNAVDFIDKNKYTFKVLLDDENEVIGKYKVSGIPTKFIVDKNQKIRFKSVGFSGTNDELVAELSAMIKLCQ